MASETKQRNLMKTQLKDIDIRAEAVPFSFDLKRGGRELRPAPLAFVHDLKALVFYLLQENERLGNLTWHDGTIPSDEIWLKIGGDKCGSSFKMSLQIVNVPKPNSVKNSFVFALFEAQDSVINLHIALDRYYDQINDLQTSKWKQYTIRVFDFGDYELSCHLYGLSGASGRHCCLWCNIKSDELIKPKSTRQVSVRTLDTLTEKYTTFVRAGSDLKKAKLHHNVIGKILRHTAHTTYMEAKSSQRILEEEKATLKKKINVYQQYLVLQLLTHQDPQGNPTIQSTAREKMIHQRQSSVNKGFEKEDGIFVRALDKALSSFNVQRQAYHGGSFIGNHIHRTLKPENIDTLCNSVILTAREHDETMVPQATTTAEKFKKAMILFSLCHDLYDGTRYFSDQDIETLEQRIDTFVAFYRSNFPTATFLPKMHILEDHIIPWVKRWRVGCGLMGEQGAASLHARFNHTERSYNNMCDRVQRSRVLLQNHILQNQPSIVPSLLKKRKTSEDC